MSFHMLQSLTRVVAFHWKSAADSIGLFGLILVQLLLCSEPIGGQAFLSLKLSGWKKHRKKGETDMRATNKHLIFKDFDLAVNTC